MDPENDRQLVTSLPLINTSPEGLRNAACTVDQRGGGENRSQAHSVFLSREHIGADFVLIIVMRACDLLFLFSEDSLVLQSALRSVTEACGDIVSDGTVNRVSLTECVL